MVPAFSPDERILYVAITRRDEGCIEEKGRGEVCTHQAIAPLTWLRTGP